MESSVHTFVSGFNVEAEGDRAPPDAGRQKTLDASFEREPGFPDTNGHELSRVANEVSRTAKAGICTGRSNSTPKCYTPVPGTEVWIASDKTAG